MQNIKRLNEINLAVTDCETTGLDVDSHEIIEIATIIYSQVEDRVLHKWEIKVVPQHIETASKEALKINGYIYNPWAYTGKLKSAMIKFNSLARDCLIMGQNISSDLKFINKAMDEYNIKPTFDKRYLELMGMAWFAVKDTDIAGMSLESFCSHFGISNDGAHSALVDCERALEVYLKIKKYLQK